jgi:hypothetical protein
MRYKVGFSQFFFFLAITHTCSLKKFVPRKKLIFSFSKAAMIEQVFGFLNCIKKEQNKYLHILDAETPQCETLIH